MKRIEIATIACFALGAGLLFPFEHTLTILFGVLLLGVSIACGVFALASPERLEEGTQGSDPEGV